MSQEMIYSKSNEAEGMRMALRRLHRRPCLVVRKLKQEFAGVTPSRPMS